MKNKDEYILSDQYIELFEKQQKEKEKVNFYNKYNNIYKGNPENLNCKNTIVSNWNERFKANCIYTSFNDKNDYIATWNGKERDYNTINSGYLIDSEYQNKNKNLPLFASSDFANTELS